MSDDVEAPFLDGSVSVEWTVELPDGFTSDDLYTEEMIEKAVAKTLGIYEDEVVDESVSIEVTQDVTWGEDE